MSERLSDRLKEAAWMNHVEVDEMVELTAGEMNGLCHLLDQAAQLATLVESLQAARAKRREYAAVPFEQKFKYSDAVNEFNAAETALLAFDLGVSQE